MNKKPNFLSKKKKCTFYFIHNIALLSEKRVPSRCKSHFLISLIEENNIISFGQTFMDFLIEMVNSKQSVSLKEQIWFKSCKCNVQLTDSVLYSVPQDSIHYSYWDHQAKPDTFQDYSSCFLSTQYLYRGKGSEIFC